MNWKEKNPAERYKILQEEQIAQDKVSKFKYSGTHKTIEYKDDCFDSINRF